MWRRKKQIKKFLILKRLVSKQQLIAGKLEQGKS
jgi:hypothetical protein